MRRAEITSVGGHLAWGTIPARYGEQELGPFVVPPTLQVEPGAWVYVEDVEGEDEFVVVAVVPDELLT